MREHNTDINQVYEDYEDTVSDLLSSNYKTFNTNLTRFLTMLDDVEPFKSVVKDFPDVAFESWYEDASSTVKGMVGSGELNWPSGADDYLAMRVALLRYIGCGEEDVPNFCSKFMYTGRHFDDMIDEFGDQVIEPTAREIRKRAERAVPPDDEFSFAPAVTLNDPPWYQRPPGIILIGVLITIIGGLALAFIVG